MYGFNFFWVFLSLFIILLWSVQMLAAVYRMFWHAQAVESKMQTGGYLLLLYFDK